MATVEYRYVNMWDELSKRFYGANRDFLKRVTLKAAYGGVTDPWLDALVMAEVVKMEEEGLVHGIR
jgi:hypothetical protein